MPERRRRRTRHYPVRRGGPRIGYALLGLVGLLATVAVAEVADARRETLELSRSVLDTVERGRALLTVLPDFLGADGPRRYFIAMQNKGELRGTGGLIGYYAILTADDGQLGITEPAAPGVIRAGRDAPGGPHTPDGTNDESRERYQHVDAAGFFSNVDVDPDLPTTGRVMTALCEDRTDEDIDGVVALDPVGLGTIMAAVGPVPVSQELATGESGTIPTPIAPEDTGELHQAIRLHAVPPRPGRRRALLTGRPHVPVVAV